MNYSYDLIFLVEERSMKEMLDLFLPRIIPQEITFFCIAHEGESDLEKSIPRKLRTWDKETKFIILRDQDSGDCLVIKEKILNLCKQAEREDILIRIVCHELESWYLGDLAAVEEAFKITSGKLSKKQQNKKYREPDRLNTAKQELKNLIPEYQEISGSKKIAKYLDLTNNTSHSFKVFLEGIKKILKDIG